MIKRKQAPAFAHGARGVVRAEIVRIFPVGRSGTVTLLAFELPANHHSSTAARDALCGVGTQPAHHYTQLDECQHTVRVRPSMPYVLYKLDPICF